MHHLLGNITTSLEAMDLKVSTREMTSPRPFFLQQIPCSVYMRELLAGTFTILCHRDRTLEWDLCGGGHGGGRLGERGVGGVWEVGIEGQEVGFPRWWKALEMGEIMQHCAIFCYQKRVKKREPKNIRGNWD